MGPDGPAPHNRLLLDDAVGAAGLARRNGRCDPRLMFERFTPEARAVMREAQDEAKRLGHGQIGVEHLLLGMLDDDDGAGLVLRELGLTAGGVRARVGELVARSEEPLPSHGQLPLAAKTKKVLELALREALSRGQNDITPQIVLLGIAHEDDGTAAQILREAGLRGQDVREAVIRRLAEREPPPPSPDVGRVLVTAAARARDDGRAVVDLRDVLSAMSTDWAAASLLAELGIRADDLKSAPGRATDSEKPSDGSAPG
jgi:ATP-dependent Clp protease ATP-binding subunit ClpA